MFIYAMMVQERCGWPGAMVKIIIACARRSHHDVSVVDGDSFDKEET